jgi:hypothetical protein
MDRQNIYFSLAVVATLLTAIGTLVARPRRAAWVRGVAVAGVVLSLVWAWATYQVPYDFKLFWNVGHDLARGIDYYRLDPHGDHQPILNPPTALPLFRAWALFPLRKGAKLWYALNALGVLALVPLSAAGLRARMESTAPSLPAFRRGILTAAIALSCSQAMGLALGQLALLTAFSVLAALYAQGSGRPRLAGLWLAVATVKVNTMLPFLLLFLRKKDRPTWATLGVGCVVLCLASGPIGKLPARVARTLEFINVTQEPGRVNDYGFTGPSHGSLVGLDHALYRLGLRDRGAIRLIQVAVLGALGVALFRAIRSGALAPGADTAAVTLYASIFLYHRSYDLVLLALPLTYAAMRLDATDAATRRSATCASVAILMALFVNPKGLQLFERWSFEIGPWGWVVQATVLPLATWLIVFALAGVWFGLTGPSTATVRAPFGRWIRRRSDLPAVRRHATAACVSQRRPASAAD